MKTNIILLFIALAFAACGGKNAQHEGSATMKAIVETEQNRQYFIQVLDTVKAYSSLKDLVKAKVSEGVFVGGEGISKDYVPMKDIREDANAMATLLGKYQDGNIIFLKADVSTNHYNGIELYAIDAQTGEQLGGEHHIILGGGYSHMGVQGDFESLLGADGSLTIKEIVSEYDIDTEQQGKPTVTTKVYRFDKTKKAFIKVE
ncbi:hypothetical protein [Thermoflexibacter ruber]|uniref:Uncharacterized protein n=1 Tax=Thermoflexibacter ruber TaxID=1003 RepID=A0A1I2HI37_9BACT|nr:hypothetical protein [Thermoflexibacter ruber]SFF29814.1 hypothetical protein SAMN04488541_102445 [Thermoflexibacter ruber]